MTLESEIRAAIVAKKAVLGFRATAKRVKHGEVKRVILATNCPEHMKSEIETAAGQSKVDVAVFEGDSSELGSLCGKPFKIAVLSIKTK